MIRAGAIAWPASHQRQTAAQPANASSTPTAASQIVRFSLETTTDLVAGPRRYRSVGILCRRF